MSQKIPSDSSQKGFAVGRGLLAAAETLNFSMNEQCSDSLHHGSTSRQLHSMSSGMGGGEGDHDPQLSRRGGGHIGNSMKLFASLGLSPADLDVLAQIPEENISVESLPQLIMQLKNRKVDSDRRMAGNSRGDLSGLSSEPSYRASRDNWDDMRVGRLGGSMGQASAHAQQGDLGYNSIQDTSAGRYELDYGHGSGGRDPGWYSDLSRDRYSGMGMGPPSAADSVFMTRRMGSPSQGKVQDFLGVIPHMFPHVCSLCDFDVHSTMEWNQHTDGLRHTENQRLLLQMYPEWDPHMATSRGGASHLQETTNQSASLLGPIPMGGGQQAGGGRMSSGWGGGAGSNVGSGKPHQHSMALKQIRSKVVVAKYDRSPLSNKALFALAEPFGTLCEHLVLKNKAFLEMETHKEARDVVSYYQQNPAMLHGKQITLYLSKELMVIQKDRRTERINREAKQGKDPVVANQSQVVFFSNLPRENEKKQELLTIARRFGVVKKHLFLTEERSSSKAFVQLGSAEDAEMLVKYHTLNPLTIQGKTVRLNICTKYKTLNVNNRSNKLMDDKRRRRSSSTGPKDKSSSSKSTKSSSSSSGKAKEDTKEPPKGEDGDAGREGVGSGREGVGSGDVVAGVMEGDKAEEYEGEGDQGSHDVGPSADNAEAVTEDPEPAANTSLESQEEKEPAPDSDDVPSTAKVLSSSDITEKAEGSEVEEGTVPGAEEKAEGEPESEQMETEATTDEPEAEVKVNSPSAEPAESSEMHEEQLPADQEEGSMEQDFPENMDDFVTLDELAEDEDLERQDSSSKEKYSSSGSSKKIGGLRVVNVVGFKRAYGFLNEILALAKPFGTVVQHLVLDVRPEAFLQLTSEEEAKAMVNFYSGNVTPTVCGKSVKIYHSQTYATIQSGRVVYVGQIPHFKSSDASLLKIAEPFGKVRRYFLNRSRNECFIEMERGEDAERMADTYKDTPPKLEGKRLTVYVSRKYKQLKYGHRPPAPDSEEKEKRSSKRERSGSETSSHRSSAAKSSAKQDEEPPVKKSREETASSSTDEPDKEDEEKMVEAPTEQSEVEVRKEEAAQGKYGQPSENSAVHEIDTDMNIKMEENEAPISILSVRSVEENGETACTPSQAEGKLSSTSPVPLGPYEPNNPVGVEYVKMGYYCRVCFLFYSNEESAKKVHCSSQSHYQKLKKHLEKEKVKAQSSTGMKTPV
ncbi:matrin-3 [Oncorhynchus mykiss]|uniref:Matrin-type domain-containing protein n=1 Tax=Oncorhynchus mykiss TaxID=8022 RepID=A0A8C7TBH4_ONCMY|nr:matrin-3 [Oncorhynchus mykiss]